MCSFCLELSVITHLSYLSTCCPAEHVHRRGNWNSMSRTHFILFVHKPSVVHRNENSDQKEYKNSPRLTPPSAQRDDPRMFLLTPQIMTLQVANPARDYTPGCVAQQQHSVDAYWTARTWQFHLCVLMNTRPLALLDLPLRRLLCLFLQRQPHFNQHPAGQRQHDLPLMVMSAKCNPADQCSMLRPSTCSL